MSTATLREKSSYNPTTNQPNWFAVINSTEKKTCCRLCGCYNRDKSRKPLNTGLLPI